MKNKTSQLLRAYRDGLHRYLKDSPNANFEETHKLGKRALGLRLETLDLAMLNQEALINVAHHSKATNAKVSISKLKDVVRMEIHDDGKGFNVHKPVLSQSCQRLGLLGMRERVEMIGGSFRVESQPGKETTIRVDIPSLPAKAATGRSEKTQKPAPKTP